MNVQAHMSGQFSGQVNQAGSQMPGPPQHNGSSFHTQMQNLNGQRNSSVMDPNIIRLRHSVRLKIFQILIRKRSQHDEFFLKRCQDVAKRLEEGLIKSARNMEEYANMNTLEFRLHGLVKRATPANHPPPVSPFVNTPTPIGTMIPTPGLQRNGNSSVMVSTTVDPTMMTASTGGSISSSTPSTSSLMPTVNGSLSGMRGGFVRAAEGFLSNSYQQRPSSFPTNSGGNNMVVAERPMSQMIPTPGFSESNKQAIINVEGASNNGAFPRVDSSVVSQQIPQRQAGGQNGQLLKNLGRQHRVQNDPLSSGFGNVGDGSGSSDSCSTTSTFGAASRPLLRPHDHLRQPMVQGDTSGSGNLENTGSSVGSLMNNPNINQVRMSSTPRASSLMNSQVNTQSSQSTSHMRPHVAEQVEKSKVQSLPSPRENHLQSSMRPSQQRPHQMPQQQPFTEYNQQKQPSDLSQTSVRNEAFQSHLAVESGSHVNSENGMEYQNEVFLPHSSSGQIQVNLHTNSQLAFHSYGPQGMHSTHLQTSQPMESDECSNNFNGQPFGAQSDALLHNHRHSNGSSFTENSFDEPVHKEFHQRMVGHEEIQCVNWSSEIPSNGEAVPSGNVMDQPRLGAAGGSLNAQRDEQYRNQLRWLLFLRHARGCRAPAGTCPEPFCPLAQKFIKHMDSCKVISCPYRHCGHTKSLLTHQRNCRDLNCPVCVPYRKFICVQKKIFTQHYLDGMQPSINGSLKSSETGEVKAKEIIKPIETNIEFPENQPSVKRLKSERSSQSLTSENGIMAECNVISSSHELQSALSSENVKYDNYLQMKPECPALKAENSLNSNHNGTETKNTTVNSASSRQLDGRSALTDISSLPKEEAVKFEKDNGQSKIKVVAQPTEQGSVIKSGKPKIKGVSLIELFTPEQVEEHIAGLRQWVGQSKAKAEKNQAMERIMTENCCQLCAVEKLSFEPPTVYCSPCGGRIKRNAMYYTGGTGVARHCFCIPCYNETRGDTIAVDGTAVAKSKMEKKKNDEETEESWVQCDTCEAWQHQICALFNGRRNDGGQAEYTCPNCYMREVGRGERQPLPQSTVLGAKDLPRTALSDHIELRLARRLKQERQERARCQGKSYDEVPGVDGVVVRVVSSVDKKLEVKSLFLDIFREENYPLEFPYKSKVVLLFQKIEGVEVCLFGMYVQEFGSECLPPNQRRVYLSYLDSVKYFRPEVKAVTGEALRTFVYHEILIGYLEYCKKRGFASCYIWACPPLKGEDYILYCHPEIQKTPKSDKLREWYLAMLRKASRENIVVELTNLYDHFFIQTGECKAKVTAARLPYFDGDYWPGAAEDMLNQINQEEEGRKLNKKGPTKKLMTKRALKASGHLDLSSNASKDVLLMHKLGESIAPMKEDFIMVHLQHSCTHCCMLMVSGNRWVCESCKKFQLCDGCYDEEQKRDNRERHPVNQKDKHGLKKIEITDVPDDTKDKDDILESEFFDTRQAFLSLCQGNHYQYDTLRSAKHSSMMVLYHLHNPTAPAFVATCHKCRLDIEMGQGWRCETCPDFDVCNACYQKGVDHPHELTNHPSDADRDAQNKEARQLRVVSLRKMLDLLVHASQCCSPQCQYPNCRKVKGLFRHGMGCKIRAPGGCCLCKQMWYLLQIHARACKESACPVPRCRDLKKHMKRSQQQSDSRRRAAVNEMIRQRTREVARFA